MGGNANFNANHPDLDIRNDSILDSTNAASRPTSLSHRERINAENREIEKRKEKENYWHLLGMSDYLYEDTTRGRPWPMAGRAARAFDKTCQLEILHAIRKKAPLMAAAAAGSARPAAWQAAAEAGRERGRAMASFCEKIIEVEDGRRG